MTGLQTFEARAALGTAAALATVGVFHWRTAYAVADRAFNRGYLAAFAGIRLLLFTAVFLLMRLPVRGDLPGYYVEEATWRLQGRVPYRDFASSYAPLSTYLYGAVYALHRSPLTLVFFAILVEIAAAVLWLRVLERVAPRQAARGAALLCLFNPISLQYVTIDGQNNVLISLLLAAAMLLLLSRRAALSGAATGVAIAAVKFLPLLFVPSFCLYAGRRAAAWFAGCAVMVAAVYGWFQFGLRAPVLSVFGREGDLKTASGLPYVVEAMSGRDLGLKPWDWLLLLALAVLLCRSVLLVLRARGVTTAARVCGTMASISALLLTLMGLAKKTWPTYSLMVLFPLSLAVAAVACGRRGWWRRTAVVVFAGFSVLSVTAHSFWSSLVRQASAEKVNAGLRAGSGLCWALLLLQVSLLVAYGWMVAVCLQRERAALRG